MAETKQEKRTFKYGDAEYYVDDLLKMHAQQENNFYRFAKDKAHYDDESIKGLQKAIASKIDGVKNGKIFDADGTMEGDVIDNITIQTKGKGLKKGETYHYDNTAGASRYISKLVENLKPVEKSTTGNWDITKNGFGAYLTGQGLDPQRIFEELDVRQTDDPAETRKTTQRRAKLKELLPQYAEYLQKKGFDFTSNDNDWDDEFQTSFDNFMANIDNMSDMQIGENLKKLGASKEFVTAFTSNKWDLSKTDEEIKAEVEEETERRENDEEERQRVSDLNLYEDYSDSQRPTTGFTPVRHRIADSNFNFADENAAANWLQWYRDMNDNMKPTYGTYLGDDLNAWNNAWKNLMVSFKDPSKKYEDLNAGIVLQGGFYDNPNRFIDLGNGYYLIKDSITDSGYGVAYRPSSGTTQTIALKDYATNNQEVYDIYEQLGYKWINENHGRDYRKPSYVFNRKQGGQLINKYQNGNEIYFNFPSSNELLRDRAIENNTTIERQAARERYIDSDNKSLTNPNAGMDAIAWTRVGTAAADLVSTLTSFVPGWGTAASAISGFGSTIVNFGADLADDAVSLGDAWKNLGLNLGMDLMGLIPGGGAASKLGKIVKTIKPYASAMIALPGIASMLANSPEIAKSWGKIFDGDPEDGGSKVTYQDYMNVLQTLNVALGVTTIGTNAYKSAKKSVKQTDKLGVSVFDNTGKRQTLLLTGDDVGKFKEANANGKAQEFLDEIEGGNNYKIDEITESNHGKFWGRDQNNEWHLFNQSPFGETGTGRSKVWDIRQQNDGVVYADRGRWKGDTKQTDMVDFSSKQKLDQFKQAKQAELDTEVKALRETAEKYNAKRNQYKSVTTGLDTDIDSTTRTKTTKESELTNQQQVIDDVNQQLQETQDWINAGGETSAKNYLKARRKEITNRENKIKQIKSGKRGKLSKEDSRKVDALNKEIEAINKQIDDKIKEVAKHTDPSRATQLQTQLNDATTKQSKLQVEVDKLAKRLDDLTKRRGKVPTRDFDIHSDAYNQLSNFPERTITFNGKEYILTPTQGLLDLTGLYKQGGPINRNKINKFLNYAKG